MAKSDKTLHDWTSEITTVIFDVDDTLYDTGTGFTAHRNGDAIFAFMVAKLNFPDAASAKVIRDEYFDRFHSTAKGLMMAEEEGRLPSSSQYDGSNENKVKLFDTQDMALWWAEKLNFSLLGGPYEDLAQVLSACPLNLVVFSNGPRKYVLKVLKELGLDEVFPSHKVFAVDDVLPMCKPEKEAFEKLFDSIGVKNPSECIMVEDSIKNIRAAKDLGMRTVFISGLNANPIEDDPAIDLHIETAKELRSALPGLWGN